MEHIKCLWKKMDQRKMAKKSVKTKYQSALSFGLNKCEVRLIPVEDLSLNKEQRSSEVIGFAAQIIRLSYKKGRMKKDGDEDIQ